MFPLLKNHVFVNYVYCKFSSEFAWFSYFLDPGFYLLVVSGYLRGQRGGWEGLGMVRYKFEIIVFQPLGAVPRCTSLGLSAKCFECRSNVLGGGGGEVCHRGVQPESCNLLLHKTRPCSCCTTVQVTITLWYIWYLGRVHCCGCQHKSATSATLLTSIHSMVTLVCLHKPKGCTAQITLTLAILRCSMGRWVVVK